MIDAPNTRVVDALTGSIAATAAEIDALMDERDNALLEVDRLTEELVALREERDRVVALAAAAADQRKSDWLKAAEKARKAKGLRRL